MSKKENYIEYYQILQNLVTQTFEFLIKIFYSFFYFCFNFIKNLIKFCFKFTKEIFYFLNESLTRNELFCLIIFVIFFVFTDRQSNKKIKFEKTKAPNLLWRIFGFLLYLPSWGLYFYASFMFFAQRTPPLDMTFNREFAQSVNNFFGFTSYITEIFNGRFTFMGLYELFLYFSERLIVKYIPEKFFKLPMFIRYHMILNSIFIVIFPMIQDLYRYIVGIELGGSIAYPSELRNDNLALNLSIVMMMFYLFTLGTATWQACRGKSFTSLKGKGSFDRLIRIHLGFESLYPSEKWSDFGMDDLENFRDS